MNSKSYIDLSNCEITLNIIIFEIYDYLNTFSSINVFSVHFSEDYVCNSKKERIIGIARN